MFGDKAILVHHKQIEETLGDAFQTKIAIASYTMACEWMRLHKALNLLVYKVLYIDIDSMILTDEFDKKEWQSLQDPF